MVQTAIASLFFAALLHENQWWRATLFTVTLAMIFNELVAAIYAQGARRAFAVGHSLAAMLFPLTLYGIGLTLPHLITVELLKIIETLQPINEENYLIVMVIFWLQLSCRSSGYLGVYWFRQTRSSQTSC